MKRVLFGLAIGAAAAVVAGCGSMGGDSGSGSMASAAAPAGGSAKAAAPLAAKSGTNTGGRVTFEQQSGGTLVTVSVTGLAPGSVHGFHVHEKGDCSAPDAMSAGGHFNPGGQPHGPQSAPHHGGDMPSLKADAAGNAQASFQLSGVTIGTGIDGLLGKGVIVHAKPDDYTTQPTGNSGARIACGVITAS